MVKMKWLIKKKMKNIISGKIFNTRYDRYIEDEIIIEKKAAKNRCNPKKDSGFTKADVLNFRKSYFCFHFANGKCKQGHKCSFSHHIPSLEECLRIDNSRDIFGRERFAKQRKDKQGVGSFMHETRTLQVTDMMIIYEKDKNTVKAAYETLWRHFGVFGTIQDVFLVPSSCMAYIRFEHRCMAEFAKEAMQNQKLDGDEIITVKWAETDQFELTFQDHKEIVDNIKQQNKINKKKDNIKGNQYLLINPSELEPEDQDDMYQGKIGKDPTKVLMNAEFNLFEQKLKQSELDKKRLSETFKRRGKGGQMKFLDYNSFLQESQKKQ